MTTDEPTPELAESVARMEVAVESIDDNLTATWKAIERLAEILREQETP